jgi:hypothetical protein
VIVLSTFLLTVASLLTVVSMFSVVPLFEVSRMATLIPA